MEQIKTLLLVLNTFMLVVLCVFILKSHSARSEDNASRHWKHSPESLQQYIDMHKPQILQLGSQEVLCLPTSKWHGNNVTVDHKFYIYDEGELKQIPYMKS